MTSKIGIYHMDYHITANVIFQAILRILSTFKLSIKLFFNQILFYFLSLDKYRENLFK